MKILNLVLHHSWCLSGLPFALRKIERRYYRFFAPFSFDGGVNPFDLFNVCSRRSVPIPMKRSESSAISLVSPDR
jgi:hypothetical protein